MSTSSQFEPEDVEELVDGFMDEQCELCGRLNIFCECQPEDFWLDEEERHELR